MNDLPELCLSHIMGLAHSSRDRHALRLACTRVYRMCSGEGAEKGILGELEIRTSGDRILSFRELTQTDPAVTETEETEPAAVVFALYPDDEVQTYNDELKQAGRKATKEEVETFLSGLSARVESYVRRYAHAHSIIKVLFQEDSIKSRQSTPRPRLAEALLDVNWKGQMGIVFEWTQPSLPIGGTRAVKTPTTFCKDTLASIVPLLSRPGVEVAINTMFPRNGSVFEEEIAPLLAGSSVKDLGLLFNPLSLASSLETEYWYLFPSTALSSLSSLESLRVKAEYLCVIEDPIHLPALESLELYVYVDDDQFETHGYYYAYSLAFEWIDSALAAFAPCTNLAALEIVAAANEHDMTQFEFDLPSLAKFTKLESLEINIGQIGNSGCNWSNEEHLPARINMDLTKLVKLQSFSLRLQMEMNAAGTAVQWGDFFNVGIFEPLKLPPQFTAEAIEDSFDIPEGGFGDIVICRTAELPSDE